MENDGFEVSSISPEKRRQYELDNMKVTAEKSADTFWCPHCRVSKSIPLPR